MNLPHPFDFVLRRSDEKNLTSLYLCSTSELAVLECWFSTATVFGSNQCQKSANPTACVSMALKISENLAKAASREYGAAHLRTLSCFQLHRFR